MSDNKSNASKFRTVEITSPICEFRYPRLTEPDFGTEKYPKPAGEFSIQMKFYEGSREANELIRQLTPHYTDALKEAEELFKQLGVAQRKTLEKVKANNFYSVIYDKETEEPTGEIFFKAGMAASGVYKKGAKEGKEWHRTPIIYDAKGVRMTVIPEIWSGTRGRVRFSIWPYFVDGTGAAGLKLRLIGAQIIDLVSGGERSAESMGFPAEDGYAYGEPEQQAKSELEPYSPLDDGDARKQQRQAQDAAASAAEWD